MSEEKRSWLQRLKDGLARSSTRLAEGIGAIVTRRRLDDETLARLEELLIGADMGVGIAAEIVGNLRRTRFNQEISAEASKGGYDVLLIDTAGRLHNKANLMAELQKISRVIKKLDPAAPHSVLLVLDATTGQNAHAQAETFRAIIGVTGLVMTKLDGTARGGVVVSLAEKYGIPVHAIGVGESADDLRPFEAESFARSLVGLAD